MVFDETHIQQYLHLTNSMTYYELQGYRYSRDGNPTRDSLARCIAELDNGKHALIFPSGICTTTALLHLLKSGDHILSCSETYGGTRTLFADQFKMRGIEVDFVDTTDLKLVENAIKPNTKVYDLLDLFISRLAIKCEHFSCFG